MHQRKTAVSILSSSRLETNKIMAFLIKHKMYMAGENLEKMSKGKGKKSQRIPY